MPDERIRCARLATSDSAWLHRTELECALRLSCCPLVGVDPDRFSIGARGSMDQLVQHLISDGAGGVATVARYRSWQQQTKDLHRRGDGEIIDRYFTDDVISDRCSPSSTTPGDRAHSDRGAVATSQRAAL